MYKTKVLRFDGPEPVLMWPYPSQFMLPLTDFRYLEVFHDDFLATGIKI